MELIIHIGPHKTGTTAIQAAFSRSASALRREGVLYPKLHWRQQAHHHLAFALKGKRIPGGERPDLTSEIDALTQAISQFDGRKVLISSEEFFTCPTNSLERLKSKLGIAVRVICFLRRPDAFLVSCYNQKIKQPGNGFSAPLKRFLANPNLIAPEMDYRSAVNTWADVFGTDHVLVETYENGSPLQRLRELLGLSNTPAEPDRRLNASVPGAVAEIMRHAKAFGLTEAKQRKLLARARQVFDGFPPLYVSNEDRRAIIQAKDAELSQLFARFGRSNPYALDAFTPLSHPKEYNLTLQDMMRLLDGYL